MSGFFAFNPLILSIRVLKRSVQHPLDRYIYKQNSVKIAGIEVLASIADDSSLLQQGFV